MTVTKNQSDGEASFQMKLGIFEKAVVSLCVLGVTALVANHTRSTTSEAVLTNQLQRAQSDLSEIRDTLSTLSSRISLISQSQVQTEGELKRLWDKVSK